MVGLPFELVQKHFFADELGTITQKQNRLSEIASLYEECLDEFSEEEKQMDFINEESTAFVNAEVAKFAKNKELEQETLDKLKKVVQLINEEKTLKKEIKKLGEELHLATKACIENLSDDNATMLIEEKWITPIIDGLFVLPESTINDFALRLDLLAKKYADTFENIDREINQAEQDIIAMMSDLTGDGQDMQGISEFIKIIGNEQ